jgi:membrane protein YdbS with pleckstrin-like domain
MKKKAKHKTQWHTVVFAVCLAVSIGLIVGGFFVPPTGVIDGSVLKAVGLLFSYAALSQLPYVIQSRKAMTIKHGNMSVSVGEPAGDDDSEEDQDQC